AELDGVLGETRVPADMEVANRLAYAGAVANETMRLRPVAPLILFEAVGDTTVADVEIPAGTNLMVLGRVAARDAAHFADPELFRPDRWLDAGPGPHDP